MCWSVARLVILGIALLGSSRFGSSSCAVGKVALSPSPSLASASGVDRLRVPPHHPPYVCGLLTHLLPQVLLD